MEKIVGVFFLGILLVFIYPIAMVFFGALSGWIVGLVFEDAIRQTLGSLGINPSASMWQIGATLGFIGGYFKSVSTGK